MARHLYIHIPFCNYICTFCDFKRDLIFKHDVDAFVDKVVAELKGPYETVYLGGGTPNALPDAALRRLLNAIRPLMVDDYEFTIEANPDSVTEGQAQMLAECGVNRVSIGAQTTNDSILALTNRHHTALQTEQAVHFVKKAGITNVSLDFIYNLPFMKVSDLDDAIALLSRTEVTHASFYALELKEGSVMTKLRRVKIDPEAEEEQLIYLVDRLEQAGFERYEVANWAKEGSRSRHNLAYWLTADWQAIGYGAWGLEDRISYHYEGSISEWRREQKMLSDRDYYFQVLMMGLRLKEGIDLQVERNRKAFEFFAERLTTNVAVRNGRLVCNDINTLHDALLPLL